DFRRLSAQFVGKFAYSKRFIESDFFRQWFFHFRHWSRTMSSAPLVYPACRWSSTASRWTIAASALCTWTLAALCRTVAALSALTLAVTALRSWTAAALSALSLTLAA